MADTKKISELNSTSNLANNDEFVVIDKNGTGADSSSSGKTSKIRFDDLKNQIGSQGQKGEIGTPGSPGRDGEDGRSGRDGQHGTDGTPGEPGKKGETLKFTDLSKTEKNSLKGAVQKN